MSNLIVMPDNTDLMGRIIGLGTVNKFTCRGFFLSRPFRTMAPIDDQADQDAIRAALSDGRLIDATGLGARSGYENRRLGGSFTSPQEEDTGRRVFYGRDEMGRMFVIIPKDEEDQKALELELATTGKISRKCEPAVELTQVEDSPVEASPKIIITDL